MGPRTEVPDRKTATFIVATDGSGDFTDIQAAIDALPAGGGKIFIRAGIYTITSTITIGQNSVVLQGEGEATEIDFPGNTVTPAINNDGSTLRYFIGIKDMCLKSTSLGNGLAINANYWGLSDIERVRIYDSNAGILMDVTGTLYNCIYKPTIQVAGASSYGIKFGSAANENTVIRGRINGDSNSTGVIVDAHGISLYDVDVESGLAIGIDVQDAGHDCDIFAPYLEANVINLQTAANTEAVTIYGGVIIDGATNNIKNDGTKGLRFINTRLQYEQFSYYEPLNGFPGRRWINPFHHGLALTSQTFTAGRAMLVEFELEEAAFIDGVNYQVGAAANGNVRVGIYGPIITEEECEAASLLVESSSTAQVGTNTAQIVSLTKTLAKAGRYYVALQSDDATGTFLRQPNQRQVLGWNRYYDRGGGYGAFTTPCPATTESGSQTPGIRVRCAALTTI